MQLAAIRDLPHAPYIESMTKVETFGECDEILRSKSFVQGSHRESSAVIGDSLIVLDGREHFDRRRMEAALFTRDALEYYETATLAPHIDAVLDWAAERGRGEDGIVRADLTTLLRLMLARITATITGIDGVDSAESAERFIHYVEEFNKGVTVEWSVEDHQVVLDRVLALRQEFVDELYQRSLDRRTELLDQVRAGELDESELPRDLLMLALKTWDDGWSEELLLSESTLFWVAATQTTTHATPHTVRHLLDWSAEHGDAELRDPAFLMRSAFESLRLHVPVHALLRVAVEDVTISSGRTFRAGERVALCFTSANRDPAAFGPNADRFDPHREVRDAKPWGLSFGGGPHLCIGRALVTGLTARTDGAEATLGTLGRILVRLFEAGIEIDEEQPMSYTEISHVDSYAAFPVRFTDL